MSRLDTLGPYFRQIRISPEDWPVDVMAAIAAAEALAMWPRFPQSATLTRQRLGHGAGEDAATARRRALGEIVEIASCCAWGDETVTAAARADLPDPSFGPSELCGFSDRQTADRSVWNLRLDGLDWIPEPADPADRIDWMRAECLFTGQTILVPADFALIGRRAPGDAAATAVSDTNGCAAGKTKEDACLRALFELIERDATGRWWYGQRHAHVLDKAAFPVDVAIVHHLGRRGRQLVMLDLTSDLGIPTVAALGMDAAGGRLAMGFATRANMAAAVRAALTELMAMELRVAVALSSGFPDANLEAWFRDVRFERTVPSPDHRRSTRPAHPETDVDLAACVARLKASGCRVAIIDFTRPEFGVPVVRAISPDLCHWKPRFGRARLWDALGEAGADGMGRMDARDVRLLRI